MCEHFAKTVGGLLQNTTERIQVLCKAMLCMRGLLQNVTERDAIPKARVLWTAVNHLPERIRNVMEEPQEDERGFGEGWTAGQRRLPFTLLRPSAVQERI